MSERREQITPEIIERGLVGDIASSFAGNRGIIFATSPKHQRRLRMIQVEIDDDGRISRVLGVTSRDAEQLEDLIRATTKARAFLR